MYKLESDQRLIKCSSNSGICQSTDVLTWIEWGLQEAYIDVAAGILWVWMVYGQSNDKCVGYYV